MRAMLIYLFPGLLRLEREKQDFEKYMPVFLAVMALCYFAYHLLVQKDVYWMAALIAIQKALILNFTYLLMLELSPDSKNIYWWSIALIALSLFLATNEPMLATLFFLFNTRVLTKSSGYLTTRWELFLMTLFVGLLFVFSPFVYPLLFGVSLLMDYYYKHKDARNLPFAIFGILLSGLWFKNGFGIMTKELDPLGSFLVFAISLLYIFRLSILKHILSFNDTKTNIISPKRVKSAGILLLISLMILAIGNGELYEFLHLWIMLACISLPYLRDMSKLFLQGES